MLSLLKHVPPSLVGVNPSSLGLDLGSSLGCEWARALTQALKVYWTRTLPLY